MSIDRDYKNKLFAKYSDIAGDITNANELDMPQLLWNITDEICHIIETKEYKYIFDTQAEFAKYIGVSNGRISQYVAASKFSKQHNLSRERYSTARVYELSLLKDEFSNFMKFANEKSVDVASISNAEYRKLISMYNARIGRDGDQMYHFVLDNVAYEMPKSVLNKYKVSK